MNDEENTIKNEENDFGTVTLSKTYSSPYDGTMFQKETVLKISKIVVTPTGGRFYKLSGINHWISDNEVYNVNINNVPKRRTVKIYSA